MIIDQYYLSEETNVERFLEMSGLAKDELASVVGYFRKDHWRFAGKMKGEVLVYASGKFTVRHHFNKKKLLGGEVNEDFTFNAIDDIFTDAEHQERC